MSAAGRESSALSVHSAVLEPLPSDAFAGRRCLVTGGLGFIGSNVALALGEVGADVTVVDALVPRHGANHRNLVPDGASAPHPGVHVLEADLADVEAFRAPAVEADVVFNLAGQVSHVDSMNDPLFDLHVNATGQFAFLELLRKENPDATVVFTSTRQIFG